MVQPLRLMKTDPPKVSSANANALLSDSQRWQVLLQRDASADGAFVYAVKTTGIYCRPGCSSRRPQRQNVTFFETPEAAEQAGFRPCKRCQPHRISPTRQLTDTMVRICQLIEASDQALSLAELAGYAGLSPHYFQRQFKKIIGVTPKQYGVAHRAQRVKSQLQETKTVTEAVYGAGFETSSNFYDQSVGLLGMTPSQYKQGAQGVAINFTIQPCWLGLVLVAATPNGICAIALGDSADALRAELQANFPKAQIAESDRAFEQWVAQVLSLIETPQPAGDLPLDIQGTAFQQQIWQTLQAIPPGTTVSYGDLAQRIGNPRAVRAVARACASNRLAVVVPCHRVVGSNGDLRGYRWGRDRKQALLDKEAASAQQLELL